MFDTTGSDYLTATNNAAFAVRFELDSFRSNKIKATFKGNAINITNYHSTIHTITDGKFSCEFGKGTKEPKFFSFVDDRDTVPGVIDYARITSNSLIIDGFAFFENVQTSRLIIYTGGTIKPGTYESKKGDVGFEYYRPSSFRDYINDTMGNLSVTIKLMTGNVVEGSFTGTNGYYNSPVSGSFVARVKNYVPEKDLENRWRFTEDADEFNYNIFGGNIRSAAKSSAGGKYYLKLKGESDNGRSTFSLQLSSDSPITTGLYQVNNFSKNFDSLYFKSETKIWNGNPTYFYVNSSNPAYCQINSIDDHTVSGTLFGKIIRYFKEGAIAIEDMRNASFTASF
jgi:hypothetical protein